VPREEANIYAKIYYKFLKQQPTSTDFFSAALNLDIGLFPSEFIQELTKINDHIGFSWVCVATKINADFVIKQHRDLIEKAFLYVQNENSRVELPLFDVFLKSVFQDPASPQLFGKTLKQTFDILISGPRCWGRLFSNQKMFIRHILHHHQSMPGASATTREMWPSRSRVECQPEFEPTHREALLQSEILSLGAVCGVGRMWCTFQVVILEILLNFFEDVWPGIVGVYH
jgi:hypothetical protein